MVSKVPFYRRGKSPSTLTQQANEVTNSVKHLSLEELTKLVKDINNLPNKVSEMTIQQKRLADLALARSCTDPEGTHVSFSNTSSLYPRILRMTNNTFLGFLKHEPLFIEVPGRSGLEGIRVWEDERLDWEDLSEKSRLSLDPFRDAALSYLEGVYWSPRNCRGEKGKKSYTANKVTSGTTPFLYFEPEFKDGLNIDPSEILGAKVLRVDYEQTVDFPIDIDFLEGKVLKYSELTEEQQYIVQLVCEPTPVVKTSTGSVRLPKSGEKSEGWVFHLKAKKLRPFGIARQSVLVDKMRVEVDCPISLYPISPTPKIGEIFPIVIPDTSPFSYTPLDKKDITRVVFFELIDIYQRIRQGKELQEYQEAIRFVASYRHEELALICRDYVFKDLDIENTIVRRNLSNPVVGTVRARGLTKLFLAEYIYSACKGVFLVVTEGEERNYL